MQSVSSPQQPLFGGLLPLLFPGDERMSATEQDLVSRLQASDPAAYEELIEDYADMVFRVAYRVLRNEQDAEDAMQETFLTVYRRIGQFRGEAKFSSWLYRIAANTALDLLRMRNRKQDAQEPLAVEDDEAESLLVDEVAPLPEDALTTRETLAHIHSILAGMSPKLSEAFVLYEIQGLSMQETADALGISLSAAKVRVHRARLLLQKELTQCLSEVEA